MSATGRTDSRAARQILGELARQGACDRDQLASATGLGKSAVTDALGELLERGLIRTVGRSSSVRHQTVELNPAGTHVIGVAVGATEVHATLADLRGAPVLARTAPLGGSPSADVVEMCRLLLAESSAEHLSQVVVAAPSALRARYAPDRAEPHETGLALEIAEELGVSVSVEYDSQMAVLGERAFGAAREHDSVAMLCIGAEVGLGLVWSGRLVRGAHGMAGIISHLPIGPRDTGSLAPSPSGRGSFDLMTSAAGMRLAMAALLEEHRDTPLQRGTVLTMSSTADQILQAAVHYDELARRVVATEAGLLVAALQAVVAVVDPELIVLGGSVGSHPAMLEPVRAAAEAALPVPVTIVSATLGDDAPMLGAVETAVDRARIRLFGVGSTRH